MPKGPGCQVDAGIIDEECRLTDIAKRRFIEAVKNELLFGTNGLPTPPLFPCGDPVAAVKFADMLDLENEAKFPDFHKNILGSYEKIACTLNLKSDFKFLPICCPVSLGFSLGVNVKLDFPRGFVPFLIPNPPALALKMKIMPPPKLIAKFPSIPSIPPPLPQFEIPPNVKMPDFNTLFDVSLAYSLGIPKLLADLAVRMPELVLKLINLPELFEFVCKVAFDSNLFGSIKPESVTQIVAMKVLTAKVVEMVLIAAVGTTLGSSPGGLTGGIGSYLGYTPPPAPGDETSDDPRDVIVSYAEELVNTSYGGGNDSRDTYASRLLPVEYAEPSDMKVPDPRALGKARTLTMLSEVSSCGLLARACLAAAGASYVMNNRVDTSTQDPNVKLYHDFFNDRYVEGTAIAGIFAAARAKNALIKYSRGDLPPLKRGDLIIVESRGNPGKEHVIIITDDYAGTLTMTTIEGGQPDPDNDNKPTAIKRKQYVNSQQVAPGSDTYSMYVNGSNEVVIAGRTVLALIDSEKLCTDRTGSDMSKSNGSVASSINDGPGFGFQETA